MGGGGRGPGRGGEGREGSWGEGGTRGERLAGWAGKPKPSQGVDRGDGRTTPDEVVAMTAY